MTFWGVSFVATKLVVAEISPSALIFARAGLGSFLLYAIPRRRAEVPPARGLGFSARPSSSRNGRPGRALLAAPATAGDLLFLASTLNWAVYSVMGHRTVRRVGPLGATAGAMLAGWLILAAPFGASRARSDFSRLSGAGWAALLFLGVRCSGLGYFFWYEALARMDASRVASFLYLEPLVTLAAAKLILGESLTPAAGAGGMMLLAGVALVQRAPGEAVDRKG